jgi:F420-dependent oxidoreductase-like protein
MDHFFQIPFVGPVDSPMLEGWSALAFAAGRTTTIKLGTLVTGVTYRLPGPLVKTATTLDVLSGGRAYFGVGAAWNEDEHRGLGVPFPPLAERFERLEETLRIARQMWSDAGRADDAQPFAGTHYHLERTLNVPQAVQRPHPPIMIGGGGEQKTLRLVAQYGDACNLFYRLGREALTQKLDVLREHCARLGRPYDEIEKTSLNHVRLPETGTLDASAVIGAFAEQAEMSFDHGIISLSNVSDPRAFEI